MIQINRHNYEEFFLLYVDRELSPAAVTAVEQFIKDNPDLADELTALQQTTLPSDDALVFDKTSLFRKAENEISIDNSTEQFLLYVDDELTPAERQSVETFVLQHPSLQESFVQLKQTKLPAEHIPFPDKQLLYKTESDRKPVIYMRWMRMVAAAAVIAFGFFLWDFSGSTNIQANGEEALAAIPKNNSNTITTNPSGEASGELMKSQITSTEIASKQNNDVIVSAATLPVNNGIQIAPKDLQANNTKFVGTIQPDVDLRTKPELIIEKQNTISSDDIVKPSINTKNLQEMVANAAITEREMMKIAAPELEEPMDKEVLAQQVVYRELDTETDSNNKSLLIGSVEINKDKLRGFFRKAASIFKSKKSEEAQTSGSNPTRSLK
ncbi:MAG: anti-sigma factor family protein [Sediminibacterium sp.]